MRRFFLNLGFIEQLSKLKTRKSMGFTKVIDLIPRSSQKLAIIEQILSTCC